MSPLLTLTRSYYAGALVQPPHAHDALQISMLLTGRVEETVGGTTHEAAPLHVAVKDAGLEHANRWALGGATLLRLEARGASLGSLTGHAAAPAWRWRFDPVAIRAFLRLAVNVHPERAIEEDTDGHDLLAALVAEPHDTPCRTPPRWLTDVIERLVAEWTPTLDTGAIAAWAHVHPVYLARCVRRWYGVSVGDLLRRERLRHTVQRLANSSERIAMVAHANGFADEAHCTRTIRDALGATPAALRRQLCAPVAPQSTGVQLVAPIQVSGRTAC
ncbi:helix-turn-helix transcriptional regulator [Gemmatimonas sp.]|uniref:AraC family transcriptional regulator n=1 Tax=Gemmatimonas sp. TaxID=1962908 RepID=UPI0035632BAB